MGATDIFQSLGDETVEKKVQENLYLFPWHPSWWVQEAVALDISRPSRAATWPSLSLQVDVWPCSRWDADAWYSAGR